MNEIVFESEEVTKKEMEPNEYFEDLKTKIDEASWEMLERNREFLSKEIAKAHSLGQENLTDKAVFMWETLEKEMILHAVGIRKFIDRQDVVKFIDNVKPKNSVKIVELAKYPRSIPDENMEDIIKARDLGVFDVIVIVYTDLTGEDTDTPEQKQFAARNRDPIAFGMFVDDVLRIQVDRMYLITDWEDEFCQLTFTKMVDELSKMGYKNASKDINIDINHVNSIVAKSKEKVEELKLNDRNFSVSKPQKKSFVSWIKGLFG